jgi:hypothetical protein
MKKRDRYDRRHGEFDRNFRNFLHARANTVDRNGLPLARAYYVEERRLTPRKNAKASSLSAGASKRTSASAHGSAPKVSFNSFNSGYYWFRKRVPDDLRNLIGKREKRFSLGTRDPTEAKRLHAEKLAEVEERWSNLRRRQRPLSPDDISREAAAIGHQLRRQLEADPYQALPRNLEIGASLWRMDDADGRYYTEITQSLSPAEGRRLAQRAMSSSQSSLVRAARSRIISRTQPLTASGPCSLMVVF